MERRNTIILLAVIAGIVLILILFLLFMYKPGNSTASVSNFQECAAAGYPVMESYPRRCTANGQTFTEIISSETPSEVENYFVERIRQQAIQNMGGAMPIEGFDARLFQGAYPGLTNEDFDNVAAINGHWAVQNNELQFIPDTGQLQTSADGTLTDEGVKMLLQNLQNRLNKEITTRSDVDLLIQQLSADAGPRNMCAPASRNAEACTAIYQPVCGWSDPERIQCIRYPCAQTYSNACTACLNEAVLYWTPGDCPSG